MSGFPWDAAMQFGFGVLKLSSRDFWGLTPRELASAFGARSGRVTPPSREGLSRLMAAYPDEVKHG
jgi:uncharacterized phage protein (TIGR02216 family)